MYLERVASYYKGSDQCVSRGRFLLLIQPQGKSGADNTYAIVRKVALRQLGHFMMGRAKIGKAWVTVSGAYGNDGLPMDVETLPADAKRLPPELYDAWNNGGGWNSAGSEATAMRAWANKEFAR